MKNHRKNSGFIYQAGIISAILVLNGIVLDMVTGSITGGDISSLPQTATERFAQLKDNWALGLYNFDLLNVINQILLVPSIFAVYFVQKRHDDGYALLALIVFLIGTTIFIVNNSALAMLDLSGKYYETDSDIRRNLIAAAGEAMLVKGAHGGLNVFTGFALPTLANFLMSHAMLRNRVFSKANSYTGLIGNVLMLAYIFMITFCPGTEHLALLVAMPGGILLMAWMIMFTLKLNKIRKAEIHESDPDTR